MIGTPSVGLGADIILDISSVVVRITQLHVQQKADSNNDADRKAEAEHAKKE